MKILIADDDPISVLYLQDMLGEWGYDVTVANAGVSGDTARAGLDLARV